jgi:hypothetical protein
MEITAETTNEEVLEAIAARVGGIPHKTASIIESFVQDGLNPDFLEDAGIETLDQHLKDVLERIETALADAKAEAKRGFTINTKTGERTEGNAEAALYAATLTPAVRAVRRAVKG